jgi:deoxyribose-phosphate aldolase
MTAMPTTTSSSAASSSLRSRLDLTKLTFVIQEDQEQSILALCAEAERSGAAAVCVRPQHTLLAAKTISASSGVKVATVIGFPEAKLTIAEQQAFPTIGAVNTSFKLQEVMEAIGSGAEELDIVMNATFFLTDLEVGGDFTEQELQAIMMANGGMAAVKWIIESDLLTPEQIQKATLLAAKAGVACIKTSTGMLTDGVGATPETVGLIRDTLDAAGYTQVWVKASGGIRTAVQAQALLAAGAERLGTSQPAAVFETAVSS